MVLDGKFSQKYPANAGVPQGSILDPTFDPTLHYMLMNFMTISSVILQYMLIIQLFIVSMIWKQLELASEFKSDLRDTVE